MKDTTIFIKWCLYKVEYSTSNLVRFLGVVIILMHFNSLAIAHISLCLFIFLAIVSDSEQMFPTDKHRYLTRLSWNAFQKCFFCTVRFYVYIWNGSVMNYITLRRSARTSRFRYTTSISVLSFQKVRSARRATMMFPGQGRFQWEKGNQDFFTF